MRLTLIGRLKANMPETGEGPATGAEANILGDEVDRAVNSFEFEMVFPTNNRRGHEITEYNAPKAGTSWTVDLTATRLTAWTPEVIGAYGRRKRKLGQAEGGHIRYEWIDEIATIDETFRIVTHSSPNGYQLFIFENGPSEAFGQSLVTCLMGFWEARGHPIAIPTPNTREFSLLSLGVPIESSGYDGLVKR